MRHLVPQNQHIERAAIGQRRLPARDLVIGNDLSTNRKLLAKEALTVKGELPWSPSQGRVELQRNHSRRAAAQETAYRFGQQGVEDPLSQRAHPCRGIGAQY